MFAGPLLIVGRNRLAQGQNTQNRDARAIHLKLDELIRSVQTAQNDLISVEKLSDAELERLTKRYDRIREEFEARKKRVA